MSAPSTIPSTDTPVSSSTTDSSLAQGGEISSSSSSSSTVGGTSSSNNNSSILSSSTTTTTSTDPSNVIPAYLEGVTDDIILQQEQDIRNDISMNQPLVSPLVDISELFPEYEENSAFLPKLIELGERYGMLRRVRGDGSCFYRSVLVSIGEAFIRGRVRYPSPSSSVGSSSSSRFTPTVIVSPIQTIYDNFLAKLETSASQLISLGYNDSTTPDFFDVLIDYVKGFGSLTATIDTHVVQPLTDENNGVALFGLYGMRLLTSLELLTNEEAYLPFILGISTSPNVEMFCKMEVETPASDVDMVQVMGLGNSLGIQICIAYLDASPGNMQIVRLPEEMNSSVIRINLLYRPGHYDVVYPR